MISEKEAKLNLKAIVEYPELECKDTDYIEFAIKELIQDIYNSIGTCSQCKWYQRDEEFPSKHKTCFYQSPTEIYICYPPPDFSCKFFEKD
jgi:hypothetical protein